MKATVFHAGRHLTEEELGPPERRCPICRNEAERPLVYRIQEAPRVDLLECPVCGGASASRMPLPAVLERYYATYYEGRADRVTCPDPSRFAARIVESMAAPISSRPFRILDFGGGDGSVALALAEQTSAGPVEITLVDYETPARPSHPRIAIRGHRELDGAEGAFDVVLASAVLEHLPEMRAAAEQLFALVAPGGWLYARTPYLAPFARFVPRLDFTYPAHVHDLGPGFWNRVIRTFSLDAVLVASRPSPVEADPGTHPLRAVIAWALKLPCRLEQSVFPDPSRVPRWRLVGGWEALLRFNRQPGTGGT